MSSAPIFLLAFANDREGSFLRSIAAEQRSILRALTPLADKKLLRVEILSDATADDIFEAFRKYGDRVKAFHYGGHAHDLKLLLSGSRRTLNIDGFASYLAQQHGLQLVFMNGCATAAQQKPLQDAGIPHLILTDAPINDEAAQLFASHFYQNLASGRNSKQSFAQAEGAAHAQLGGDFRDFVFTKTDEGIRTDRFPWLYKQHDESEFALKVKRPSPLRWAIPTGVGLIILGVLGWYFKPEPGPFDFTVRVQGDALDEKIDEGEVIIEFEDQSFRRKLDQDRMAEFKIDHAFVEKASTIRFMVHNQPYEAIWGDSSIILAEDGLVSMPVSLKYLDKITGYLYDLDTDNPLEGVSVRANGITAQTDSTGWFVLDIPKGAQLKFQDIDFQKAGYKPDRLSRFAVHTRQEIRLPLERN